MLLMTRSVIWHATATSPVRCGPGGKGRNATADPASAPAVQPLKILLPWHIQPINVSFHRQSISGLLTCKKLSGFPEATRTTVVRQLANALPGWFRRKAAKEWWHVSPKRLEIAGPLPLLFNALGEPVGPTRPRSRGILLHAYPSPTTSVMFPFRRGECLFN